MEGRYESRPRQRAEPTRVLTSSSFESGYYLLLCMRIGSTLPVAVQGLRDDRRVGVIKQQRVLYTGGRRLFSTFEKLGARGGAREVDVDGGLNALTRLTLTHTSPRGAGPNAEMGCGVLH